MHHCHCSAYTNHPCFPHRHIVPAPGSLAWLGLFHPPFSFQFKKTSQAQHLEGSPWLTADTANTSMSIKTHSQSLLDKAQFSQV